MTRIAVVSAGLGTPSATRVLADQLAEATRQALPGAEVEVIELRPLAHALMDHLLTGFPSPPLRAALDAVTEADGLIAVTPVFTASYSALFKAFFDVVEHEALAGMPVLIAATGGTERHSLALEHAMRPLFAYLRAHVAPTAVYAATSDFKEQALAERVDRATREFTALITGLGPRRKEFDDLVPFAQLLADQPISPTRVGGLG
jgi:FMN reductase